MKSIHEQFIEALQKSDFKGDVSTQKSDIEEHAFDESIFTVEPQVVIYPETSRDIQIAVRAVNQLTNQHNPLHLTPRAAGTGLSGGSLNDSIVINTTRNLNRLMPFTEYCFTSGSLREYTLSPSRLK